jgi:hypothetical protein
MNSDESAPTGIEYLRCCEVCERQFISAKRSARCCSRKDCRALVMDFDCFLQLQAILKTSHWAGGLNQEESLQKYLEERMWEAVRRLPHSEDLLGEVLVEILEELLEAAPGCPAERV